MMDDGTEAPLFYSENDKLDQFIPLRSVKPIADVSGPAPKDPIEYLKSAHADGDMIGPATMLRECYGITKTERVVVEWSEVKEREIKVGDKVRIVGPASYTDQSAFMGDVQVVAKVDIVDIPDKVSTYYLERPDGFKYWFPASSVELV